MPKYGYRPIHVKGHYRTYRKGSYPGPYRDERKWINPHVRILKNLTIITQRKNVINSQLYRQTMTKEIPDNFIEGVKKLAKDQDHEYSIDIDFERQDKVPQQMLIMEGGRTETVKVGDFELFGHTHPDDNYPRPSNMDLKIMYPLRPEFIVSNKTGKTIILNIEDHQKWQQWKNSGSDISVSTLSSMDSKWGRKRLFDLTGVQVYPMTKNMKIQMIDDPHYEKRFPRVPSMYMEKWHKEKVKK